MFQDKFNTLISIMRYLEINTVKIEEKDTHRAPFNAIYNILDKEKDTTYNSIDLSWNVNDSEASYFIYTEYRHRDYLDKFSGTCGLFLVIDVFIDSLQSKLKAKAKSQIMYEIIESKVEERVNQVLDDKYPSAFQFKLQTKN